MAVTNVQSVVNTIVATALFRFHPGASIPATTPALPAGYDVNFGEAEYTIKSNGDIKELWLASGGVLGKSKKKTVKPTLVIERDLQYIPPLLLGYFSGTGASGGTPSFSKVIEGWGWIGLQMEDENVQSDGSGIWVYHSFACDLVINGDMKADGSDFGMLKMSAEAMLGRAKGTVVISPRPIATV